MFQNENLSKEIQVFNNIGKGSFGSVYVCKNNNDKIVAMKCEKKNSQTLFKEFKFYCKIYNIKNYLNNNIEDINKDYIKIYEYIKKHNILSIPEIISEDILKNGFITPQPYSFYDCDDYDFLTMDLCGNNFEDVLKNYNLTEKCKYFIAYKLLYIMASFHRCGIIHRDMKLANLVLNENITNDNIKNLKLMLIDLGLSKEFYVFKNGKVQLVKPNQTTNITGTIRYISLNIHEYNTPTIIDDLISMCYMLVNICTESNLPWCNHIKDEKKFNRNKHTLDNCKCNYYENLKNKRTKNNNTIAEMKFHTPLNILCGKYTFLNKWLKYLYSLNLREIPNYTILFKILVDHTPQFEKLNFEFIVKNK